MSQPRSSYHTRRKATDNLAAASPLLSRGEITARLHDLREQVEREMAEDGLGYELGKMQAAVMMDVCRVLGLDQAQTLAVLGVAYYALAGSGAKVGASGKGD